MSHKQDDAPFEGLPAEAPTEDRSDNKYTWRADPVGPVAWNQEQQR